MASRLSDALQPSRLRVHARQVSDPPLSLDDFPVGVSNLVLILGLMYLTPTCQCQSLCVSTIQVVNVSGRTTFSPNIHPDSGLPPIRTLTAKHLDVDAQYRTP